MVDSAPVSDTPELQLASVRSHFPAFDEPALSGQAFFENAGGSYACRAVIDRLYRYYCETKVQPYYPSPASTTAGQAMDQSYARLAPWLGVTDESIHFGPSTTQNTYVLAQAALAFLSPGDNIVVTEQEHEANRGAWRRLKGLGIEIREWHVHPESGRLDPGDLAPLLGDRTRLVAFTHCSNVIGQVNPVAEIANLVRDAGALSIVDGVSYAAHGFPDVTALGVDVYLFSLYKTYGPHQGLMVAAPAVVERFANQGHYFNAGYTRKRLVPAGPDHAQIAAAQGIADYFEAIVAAHGGATDAANDRKRVAQLFKHAERARLRRLLDGLETLPRVRIVGPTSVDDRAPTVSITVDGYPSDVLCTDLAERGVMAGYGHFYAKRLLEALGIAPDPGVLRLSFVHYTSDEDVDQALAALDDCLRPAAAAT